MPDLNSHHFYPDKILCSIIHPGGGFDVVLIYTRINTKFESKQIYPVEVDGMRYYVHFIDKSFEKCVGVSKPLPASLVSKICKEIAIANQ